MSSDSARYAELLAPAFTGALEGISEPVTDLNIPVLGFASCQALVKEALGGVNWEDPALEIRQITYDEGDTIELSVSQYAERLMGFAFDDAYKLIQICERATGTMQLPTDVSFGQIMLNSGHSLLAVSRISDRNKSRLLSALDLTETVGSGPRIANVPDVNNPLLLNSDSGMPKFVWSQTIQDWLDERRGPDTGCPAHGVKVEHDSKKISSVYFFWDKLIRSMYKV